MPWFEYVCGACGAKMQRRRPVAHRDVPPRRHQQDGCWDGVLRRVAPVRGPGALRWADEKRRADRDER